METYITTENQKLLDTLLAAYLKDSLRFWKVTRINGASVGMSLQANENTQLIMAFDEVAFAVRALDMK